MAARAIRHRRGSQQAYHGHEPRGAQKTEMATLDSFCLDRGRLDLLKVDTDRFDFEVLRGGEESLRRHSPIVFLEFTPDFAPTRSAGAGLDAAPLPPGAYLPEVINSTPP